MAHRQASAARVLRVAASGRRGTARALALAAWLAAPLQGQTAIHVIDGGAAGEWLGWKVAGVGDVDGDAVPDLALGAPLADQRAGRVELRSGADGSLIRALHGASPGDQFGGSVDGVGDLDGDGHADLVVGIDHDAPIARPGAAEVRSGLTGALLLRFDGESPADRFGRAAAGAGDVNGDGIGDVVVGAPEDAAAGPLAGSARVYSGLDGSVLHVLHGPFPGSEFGSSVAGVGDVDGDGFDDLCIGAPGAAGQPGTARLHSGASGSVLRVFVGEQAGDRFGHAVDGAGDVDGDGVPDLIVGAPFGGANGAGLARVLSGADGSGVHLFAGALALDRFGWSVSGAGDVDLDGRADLVVGAPTSRWNGEPRGSIQLFAGSDGARRYTLHAGSEVEWFGESVDDVGDVSANGIPDLVVGAPFESANGGASGRARTIEGLDEPAPRYCFGDDSGQPCPCGNAGAPQRGCASSASSGAILSSVASRSFSAAADLLVLSALELVPGRPTLLFAGRNQVSGGSGAVFGDGLRCAGGDVVRLGVEVPGPAGNATWGPGLVAEHGFSAGESWNFQAWYRDPSGPCGLGFNLSNGIALTFSP